MPFIQMISFPTLILYHLTKEASDLEFGSWFLYSGAINSVQLAPPRSSG